MNAEYGSVNIEKDKLLSDDFKKGIDFVEQFSVLGLERQEPKEKEQELFFGRFLSEDIIEAIPSLFYVIDEKGNLVKWNKNVEVVTGYSPEELRNLNAQNDFVNEDEREYVCARNNEVFMNGKSFGYVNFKKKDGSTSPYFLTGVRTYINGKYYQIGVGIDCAELEEAKESLRETNERLALAAESSGAGFWVLDLTSNSMWMNQQCIELHGMAPKNEVKLETLLDMIYPEDRDAFRNALNETVRTGRDFKTECRIVSTQERVRWLDIRGRLHFSSLEKWDRLMGFSMDITDRKLMEEQLREHMKEVVELKKQLENENVYLREEVNLIYSHEELIGESKAFKNVLAKAEQVSPTESTVLILGETGTGKDVLARAIHGMSRRSDRPLVTVNCASLPAALIESELFGREKGAYTGALTRLTGRFEVANGSTLFLDEIGELSIESQGKLLRAIEHGCFERLGSTKSIRVDVRIIAATNKDLAQVVSEGKFRSDLYYRLNVFPIVIPPLRERLEDIPALVWAFVEQLEKKMDKRIESIPQKTLDSLRAYSWPGNIRELKNIIEHAMIISDKKLKVYLPASSALKELETDDLKEIERKHILDVLERTRWRIGGENGAAKILGLKRTTLIYKMKTLGIKSDL